MGAEQQPPSHFRDKIIVLIFIWFYSSCVMGLNLFVPQILTSIIKYHHPNYTKDELEGDASTFKSFMDGANAVFGLLLLPVLGGISDVFGRKKIMIVGSCCLFLYMGVLKAALIYNQLWVVYICSLFSIYQVNQACAIAFMSDISRDEKEKAMNFGLVLAAFMAGLISGSLGVGYLGKFGTNVALYTLFGMCAGMILFLLLVFHESTEFYLKRHERKFSLATNNPFVSLRLILGMNPYVTTLVIVYAINFLGVSDTMTSGVLYTLNRYNWGSFQNGIASAVGGIVSIFWQGLGVRLLLKVLAREHILTLDMYLTSFIHFMFGYAPVGWMYLSAVVAGGFSSIAYPLMQSLISERIPREQQGIAFGGLSSISSIATFVGALFSENVFSYCLHKSFWSCPGTAFYICGLLFIVNGTICVVLFVRHPPKKENLVTAVSINSEEEALLKNTD
eukprot:Phypoly_transcript_06634.p1 GENE.Phypoly_transcript_06634~~Phypoly_transcript_06634.p1  ORF type:complete len:448 (+),score=31.79 Phypoly_transcript_06634:359-1702(+)